MAHHCTGTCALQEHPVTRTTMDCLLFLLSDFSVLSRIQIMGEQRFLKISKNDQTMHESQYATQEGLQGVKRMDLLLRVPAIRMPMPTSEVRDPQKIATLKVLRCPSLKPSWNTYLDSIILEPWWTPSRPCGAHESRKLGGKIKGWIKAELGMAEPWRFTRKLIPHFHGRKSWHRHHVTGRALPFSTYP